MSNTLINHAIAIPSNQHRVWSIVGDLGKNPIWQADCDGVTFLSTMRTGRGTRWRNLSATGREYVLEINAWYAGLGYEFIIVDGLNIKDGNGRIRLQETAEGTVVQWTFTYELQGLLSGMRNSLGTKRAFDHDIIDSLQNLYSYIKSLTGDEDYDSSQVRAIMQEAPDVASRSQYQRRFQEPEGASEPIVVPDSDIDERFKPPTEQFAAINPIIIDEPPVADDDTKPNESIQRQLEPATDRDVAPLILEEPSFLRDLPTDKPKGPKAPPAATIEEPSSLQTEASYTEPIAQTDHSTAPIADDVTEPTQPDEFFVPPVAQPLTIDGDEVSKYDTARISVFDVFGLQKPSETEQVRAIRDADLNQEAPPEAFVAPQLNVDVLPDDTDTRRQRIGLRVRLRNHRVKIRRPS